jgi:hypothetical protein
VLAYDMHNAISDRISTNIFIQQLILLYVGEELPETKIQYRDYSVWEDAILKSEALSSQQEYWLNWLEEEITPLNMPTDYEMPFTLSFEGDDLNADIGSELFIKLNRYAKNTDADIYTVLYAAYIILLSKYSNQQNVVTGFYINGREQSELKEMIGAFEDFLPIRSNVAGERAFTSFLNEVNNNIQAAVENQQYKPWILLDRMGTHGGAGQNSLFNHVFAIHDNVINEISLDNLKLIRYQLPQRHATFDLSLNVSLQDNGISLCFNYNTALFARDTIESISEDYAGILESIVITEDMSIYEIRLQSESKYLAVEGGIEDVEFDI